MYSGVHEATARGLWMDTLFFLKKLILLFSTDAFNSP